MVGVLIVNGKPLILDQVSHITPIVELQWDGAKASHYFGLSDNFLNGKTISNGDYFFMIKMSKGNSSWSHVLIYHTKEEAEKAMLSLVEKMNNVLSTIPKLDI